MNAVLCRQEAVKPISLVQRRLKFCSRDTQLKWFERQLELSKRSRLPLFLHMRAACAELLPILQAHPECWSTGVVHSFDGTQEEAQSILSMPGLKIGQIAHPSAATSQPSATSMLPTYAVSWSDVGRLLPSGLNGCSLKTEWNLKVVAQLPLHRVLLETGDRHAVVRSV